jgi:hypothetical protein
LSQFDLATFGKLAAQLRFQRPSVTFAANSIKLKFSLGAGDKDRYVWIDPPWELWRNHRTFLYSASYPTPQSAVGRREERAWLRNARWFRPGAFLALSRELGPAARFRFANGWSIIASAAVTVRDPEQWYDDWYIADSQAPSNTSLERTRGR